MRILALATALLCLSGPDERRWIGHIELPGAQRLGFVVVLTDDEAGDSGHIDIPVQGVEQAELSDVEVDATSVRFTFAVPGAPAMFEATIAGNEATGTLRQGGATLPIRMRLAKDGEDSGFKRPQHPTPPFPYGTVEVTVEGWDGAMLAGTLAIPPGEGPFPAVVFLTGSGAQDRDETLAGHKPFLVLSDALARRGIASLRCDDRGYGDSEAGAGPFTMAEFAKDAALMLSFLSRQDRIDGSMVGFVGHSEGAIVGPMAVADGAAAAFLVLIAGPAVPGKELMPEQLELVLLAGGTDAEAARRQREASSRLYEAIVAGAPGEELDGLASEFVRIQLDRSADGPDAAKHFESGIASVRNLAQNDWFRHFLAHDPGAALERVSCPVLAVNGQKDVQVPVRNLGIIEAALRRGGNERVRVIAYPDLNHLMQTCTTGSPGEYAEITETFSPRAIEDIGSWILDQSRAAGSR